MAVMASVAAMTAAPENGVESGERRVESGEPRVKSEERRVESGVESGERRVESEEQLPTANCQLPTTPDSPAEVDAPVEPAPIPSMEELEHNDNALLFDEVILHPEPEAAPKATESAEQSVESVEPLPTASEPSVRRVAEGQPGGQASLLDYLTPTGQRTLGETLAEGRPAPTALERKVDDLRTVININDKFSFMSELFHNNMKAYNDFILRLNALKDREEALAQVREVAQQQRWVEGSPTVQTFYKIFDKKF